MLAQSIRHPPHDTIPSCVPLSNQPPNYPPMGSLGNFSYFQRLNAIAQLHLKRQSIALRKPQRPRAAKLPSGVVHIYLSKEVHLASILLWNQSSPSLLSRTAPTKSARRWLGKPITLRWRGHSPRKAPPSTRAPDVKLRKKAPLLEQAYAVEARPA